jgi:hypothetical protein
MDALLIESKTYSCKSSPTLKGILVSIMNSNGGICIYTLSNGTRYYGRRTTAYLCACGTRTGSSDTVTQEEYCHEALILLQEGELLFGTLEDLGGSASRCIPIQSSKRKWQCTMKMSRNGKGERRGPRPKMTIWLVELHKIQVETTFMY